MGRKRIIPEIKEDELGPNPFVQGLEVWINKKYKPIINKFGNEDVLETKLEKIPYTKLYDSPLPDQCTPADKLPIRSKELYLHILHHLKPAKDWIWIDRVKYMESMGITSVNTFRGAVIHLAAGGYVSIHPLIQDLLWINPHFFFKGSRVNKYPDKVRWEEKLKK